MRAALGAIFLCLVAGCASRPVPAPIVSPDTACAVPRPQVCTMEWAPVCAVRLDGTRKTYASACNACADDQVASHDPGECQQ